MMGERDGARAFQHASPCLPALALPDRYVRLSLGAQSAYGVPFASFLFNSFGSENYRTLDA